MSSTTQPRLRRRRISIDPFRRVLWVPAWVWLALGLLVTVSGGQLEKRNRVGGAGTSIRERIYVTFTPAGPKLAEYAIRGLEGGPDLSKWETYEELRASGYTEYALRYETQWGAPQRWFANLKINVDGRPQSIEGPGARQLTSTECEQLEAELSAMLRAREAPERLRLADQFQATDRDRWIVQDATIPDALAPNTSVIRFYWRGVWWHAGRVLKWLGWVIFGVGAVRTLISARGEPDVSALRRSRCPYCFYDISGLNSTVCPECGHEFAGVLKGALPPMRWVSQSFYEQPRAQTWIDRFHPHLFRRRLFFPGILWIVAGLACVISFPALRGHIRDSVYGFSGSIGPFSIADVSVNSTADMVWAPFYEDTPPGVDEFNATEFYLGYETDVGIKPRWWLFLPMYAEQRVSLLDSPTQMPAELAPAVRLAVREAVARGLRGGKLDRPLSMRSQPGTTSPPPRFMLEVRDINVCDLLLMHDGRRVIWWPGVLFNALRIVSWLGYLILVFGLFAVAFARHNEHECSRFGHSGSEK